MCMLPGNADFLPGKVVRIENGQTSFFEISFD